MKTTLFLPVLNEVEGCRLILPRIDPSWVDEIIVVDGHSTDGTIEFLQEHWGHLPHYTLLAQRMPGVCAAFWECYEIATGDVIIPFSPDNNSVPELIPPLIEKIREGNDLVVVSRYLEEARSEDDDVVTAFGNWLFTRMVNLFFRARYTDTLVMFRALRRDLIERLNITERRMPVFELLLQIRCAKAGFQTAEIPGDEPARVGGQRKMKPLYNGSCILYHILRERIFWNFQPATVRKARRVST